MKILTVILFLLVLWFQFGSDLFERYQVDQCFELKGGHGGVSITPWIVIPGNFVFLNIRVVNKNTECVPENK